MLFLPLYFFPRFFARFFLTFFLLSLSLSLSTRSASVASFFFHHREAIVVLVVLAIIIELGSCHDGAVIVTPLITHDAAAAPTARCVVGCCAAGALKTDRECRRTQLRFQRANAMHPPQLTLSHVLRREAGQTADNRAARNTFNEMPRSDGWVWLHGL